MALSLVAATRHWMAPLSIGSVLTHFSFDAFSGSRWRLTRGLVRFRL